MLKGANGYTLKSRLDDMATEGGRGGCCTQAPTFWGGPTAGGGGTNYHVEDRAAHNLAAGVGPVYSARCPSATDAAMVSTLKNFADANAHNPPSCNNYSNNYQHQPLISAETCGAGSSTASTTSTATCSTTSTIPPPQPSNGCVTDKVMGVVSSVKTLGRNPVLATLIWLLGGSTTEVEVPRDHESRHGRGIRRHRWHATAVPAPGAAPAPSVASSSGANTTGYDGERERNKDKVVLFLGDRDPVQLDAALGPVMATRRYASGPSDSQCMYPEHIAVEKITHMDRCETDDLPFQQQQLQQQHSHESTANGADVSPQWGWYVTLTPPQAEYFAKEAAKARARATQELRPPPS